MDGFYESMINMDGKGLYYIFGAAVVLAFLIWAALAFYRSFFCSYIKKLKNETCDCLEDQEMDEEISIKEGYADQLLSADEEDEKD
jgi:hypothetical protein